MSNLTIMGVTVAPIPHTEPERVSLHMQMRAGESHRVIHVYRTWQGMPYGANYDPTIGAYEWTCERCGVADCLHVRAAQEHIASHPDELAIATAVQKQQDTRIRAELDDIIER